MNIEDLKNICKNWNDLKTDKERYKYLIENKGIFVLRLDNDDTFPEFSEKFMDDFGIDIYDLDGLIPELESFDYYLGWSDGVKVLLKMVGIEAEEV